MTALKSRAALRPIEPGWREPCAGCGKEVIWKARAGKPKRVVCNVYKDGAWQEVLIFHPHCYSEAGEPYGVAL